MQRQCRRCRWTGQRADHEPGFPTHRDRDVGVRMQRETCRRLLRLTSSLRVRLVSSKSSQSCPRRAHRADGRVPLIHLRTWDCKAVRYGIPWLRPEWKYFRVDEEMPCENGATARKGPSFRIPLILCSRFLVCISHSPTPILRLTGEETRQVKKRS